MDTKAVTQIPSSTGGTITFRFDKNGQRIGLTHSASTAYSGKRSHLDNKSKKD